MLERAAPGGVSDGAAHLRFRAGWRGPSRSSIYNTRLKGRSNAGHEFPFNLMREPEKRAVTEFLKLL